MDRDVPVVKTGNLLVVGSVTADLTAYSPRNPAPGETLLGDRFLCVLGGKGSNQAIAASLGGAQVHMVGCVGSDLFTELVREGLTAHGVNTRHLSQVPGPTGVAHIRVDGDGENSIVIVPMANSLLTTELVESAFTEIDAPKVLLTQLEIPTEVTEYAIKRAHRAGMTVILDPAPAQPLPHDLWQYVTIVTPNESEAEMLTGIAVEDHDSALHAGRWFTDRGVTWAIVTLADDGALLVWAEGSRHFPSVPVNAVDTTAAGDAFSGHLGASLSLGAPLDEAIEHAIVAGAIAVTRMGASPSLPTRAEVEEIVNSRNRG